MLNLAATESLQGAAGTGSVVTFTVAGMEISSGTEAYKILAQGSLAAVAGSLYTVGGGKQGFVKKIHLLNTSALPILVTMFINGTAATNQFGRLLLPANGSADYVGEGWNVYDSSGFRQYVGATGPTGAKGAQYIGIYSAAVNYVADNIVSDNGTAWICLVANGPGSVVHAPPTIPTTSNTWWSLIASKGDQGIQGIQGNPGVVTSVVGGAGMTETPPGGSAAAVTLDVVAGDPGVVVGAGSVFTSPGGTYAGTVTAANKTYVVGDRGKVYLRNNSGSAMADTLPTLTNTAADIGWWVKIQNIDTVVAAAITVTTPTGTFQATGLTTMTMRYGTRQTFVWDGTRWLFDAGTINLVRVGGSSVVAGRIPTFLDTDGRIITDAAGLSAASFDAAGLAAAAQAASQPLDGDLTAIAALATTAFGRSQLTYADAAAATAALNAATTLLSGLMTAVEKKKLSGKWVDVVAEYGADPTGSVDAQTAITNAMADSRLATGGVLFFQAGTYKVDLTVAATITVTKPIIFLGCGRSISVINITHATRTCFTMGSGSQGGGFEQIRISAPLATTRSGGYGIDLSTQANVYIQQCDILFQWTGVHSSGALQFIDDVNIREGGANAINGAAVLVDGTGDRYIRRLTTDQAPAPGPTGYAGIRINECSSCVISDSNIIRSRNALDITPNAGGGHAVASVLAVNTFFDTSAIGCNVVPASNSDTAQRIRFINCWFSTMTVAGVVLGNAAINVANVNAVSFIGCDFYQNPVGIDSLGIAEWDVRASRISGNTVAGIRVVQGLQAGVQNFSISDNFIGNGAGFGQNLVGLTIGAGTYGRYQVLDNRGLETNGISPVGQPGLIDLGSVGPTGQRNVQNNMGALVSGTQNLLTSGAAALVATAGRGIVTSTTVETFLFTCRIPANSVQPGQQFRVVVVAQSSSTGIPSFRIRTGAAGTLAGDTNIHFVSTGAAGAANSFIWFEGLVTVVTVGAPGTVVATGAVRTTAASAGQVGAAEVVANITQSAAWFITVTLQTTIAAYTVKSAFVEVI